MVSDALDDFGIHDDATKRDDVGDVFADFDGLVENILAPLLFSRDRRYMGVGGKGDFKSAASDRKLPG